MLTMEVKNDQQSVLQMFRVVLFMRLARCHFKAKASFGIYKNSWLRGNREKNLETTTLNPKTRAFPTVGQFYRIKNLFIKSLLFCEMHSCTKKGLLVDEMLYQRLFVI